jgi:hypothetical protein
MLLERVMLILSLPPKVALMSMGYGIYFKIVWYADLDMLNMFAV